MPAECPASTLLQKQLACSPKCLASDRLKRLKSTYLLCSQDTGFGGGGQLARDGPKSSLERANWGFHRGKSETLKPSGESLPAITS